MTPLGDKVNEIMSEALQNPDGYFVWRDMILGEQWKIVVDYDGNNEKFSIVVKRRDPIPIRQIEE